MPDSNYPSPFGPLTDEMRFATRAARTLNCSVCAVSRVFQASPNFARDLAEARWARSPEIGGDVYWCPECPRLGEARAAE
ncbi:MAG: hypothetical protein M3O36_18145 [Myxococcota bacterium]|nr:hypothetical protein [Myxococcota bacterium]